MRRLLLRFQIQEDFLVLAQEFDGQGNELMLKLNCEQN